MVAPPVASVSSHHACSEVVLLKPSFVTRNGFSAAASPKPGAEGASSSVGGHSALPASFDHFQRTSVSCLVRVCAAFRVGS